MKILRTVAAVLLLASPGFAASYNKVNVTTGQTQIIATQKNRASWLINNSGTSTVWLGFDTSVSSNTGMPLLPNEKLLNDGPTAYRGAIYGITDTGTQDVRFLEWGNNDL